MTLINICPPYYELNLTFQKVGKLKSRLKIHSFQLLVVTFQASFLFVRVCKNKVSLVNNYNWMFGNKRWTWKNLQIKMLRLLIVFISDHVSDFRGRGIIFWKLWRYKIFEGWFHFHFSEGGSPDSSVIAHDCVVFNLKVLRASLFHVHLTRSLAWWMHFTHSNSLCNRIFYSQWLSHLQWNEKQHSFFAM